MSNATVKDPPGQEPAPVIPADAREALKAKFSEWQALIRKRVDLTSKLDQAKNRETALLQTSESNDSEETVRQLQDAQTKQRVYAAQIECTRNMSRIPGPVIARSEQISLVLRLASPARLSTFRSATIRR